VECGFTKLTPPLCIGGGTRAVAAHHGHDARHLALLLSTLEREFFIDNLLIRTHFIIVMFWWTGLASWEFEFPFPGSLTFTLSLQEVALARPRRITATTHDSSLFASLSRCVSFERGTPVHAERGGLRLFLISEIPLYTHHGHDARFLALRLPQQVWGLGLRVQGAAVPRRARI